MELNREDITPWRGGPLSWSTQYNDLRDPESVGHDTRSRKKQLLRELKRQALFELPTVIRDADLVNNIELLQLLLEEPKCDLYRSFEDKIHVFALRSGAENFTNVNEGAGHNRAFPKRYRQAEPLIRKLDQLVYEHGVVVASVDRKPKDDTFRQHLSRIAASNSMLEEDRKLLEQALSHGIEAADKRNERLLRFGDVFGHLLSAGIPAKSNLIQWCRAAHVLTVPSELKIAPSSSNQDLAPEQVAFILSDEQYPAFDSTACLEYFPRWILFDQDVDQLTFAEIASCRKIGTELGYFKSIEALHDAFSQHPRNGKSIEDTFVSYLDHLARYLRGIGKNMRLGLFDWQKNLGLRKVLAKEKAEDLAVCVASVPVTASLTSIFTTSPIALAASTVINPTVLWKIHELIRSRHPTPLRELIDGATVVPPSGKQT